MKRFVMLACMLVVATAALADTENFDSARPGGLPAGWVAGVTGRGAPQWAVETDASAPSKPNVLMQSGRGDYPWCVKKNALVMEGSPFKVI
ncbi:MAG: hypothetical protein MZV65_36505 [Chromatiales bacterium]|nr:hypothetical protein [Chromatiales bacterium]